MATYAYMQNRFIFIFAGIMLAAGLVYYGYQIVDGFFLTEKEGIGKVTGKEHIPFSEKYQMMNVGGTNQMVKIAVPETWLFTVDLGGVSAQASVPPDEFQSVLAGT